MVVWMLQRHLLVQLHTYVFFVPPVPRRKKKVSEEWNILDGTLQRSPSFSDNASGRNVRLSTWFYLKLMEAAASISQSLVSTIDTFSLGSDELIVLPMILASIRLFVCPSVNSFKHL